MLFPGSVSLREGIHNSTRTKQQNIQDLSKSYRGFCLNVNTIEWRIAKAKL